MAVCLVMLWVCGLRVCAWGRGGGSEMLFFGGVGGGEVSSGVPGGGSVSVVADGSGVGLVVGDECGEARVGRVACEWCVGWR